MTAKTITPLIACAALGLATAASAEQILYKWVDKDGKVQYSDMPPNIDAKVTETTVKGGGPDTAGLPFATQMARSEERRVGKECRL